MHTLDSDQMPLPELVFKTSKPRAQWRRSLETGFTIGVLFLSGFGTGFIYQARVNEATRAQDRADHQNEIARLQDTQARALQSTSRNVVEASQATAQAADQVTQAAAVVEEVGKKVDRANKAPK